MFPKIQRPCPYKNDLASIIDGDVCRVCVRKVHDLNAMSTAERAAFLSACAGEVCVSYSLRPTIIAAAMTIALPAAAQDYEVQEETVLVGGFNAAKVEYIADHNALETPEAPVIYEDEGAPQLENSTAPAANLNDAVEAQ
ncbi:MAG: hypothetical protein R3C27_08055 [Hyphomonadaceae bacterium]